MNPSMSRYYTTDAVHEAGHFIIYLVNCKRDTACPDIGEISLQPLHKNHRAYMSRKMFPSEMYRGLINSDTMSLKAIEYNTWVVKAEIRTLLAGIAAETIFMRADQIDGALIRTLTIFYKKDKKEANSDLNKAIAYNTVISSQTKEEGALPLLDLFEETVKDVKTYWDEVLTVSAILEKEKIIEGDKLQNLIDDIYERLNVTLYERT